MNKFPHRWHGFWLYLTVFLFAVGLTIVLTWPLTLHLSSYYQDFGDYPLNGWILWYNTTLLKSGAILKPLTYFNAPMMFPEKLTFAYGDHLLIPSLLFAPIFLMTKNLPLSVNLWVMAMYPLTFLSAFYFLNYFSHNKRASILGAFVFAFNPLTFAHSQIHLQLLPKFFLPLVFLYAYRYVTKPTFKLALFFFVFFTLNTLSVIYFQVFTILTLPLFFLPFIVRRLVNKDWGYIKKLVVCGLVGLPFLAVLVYWNFPYWKFTHDYYAVRTLNETREHAAQLVDWIAPAPNNLLYSQFVKIIDAYRQVNNQPINYPEHTLFVNVIPLAILIYGFLRFRKKIRINAPVISFLVVTIFAGLLAAGPEPKNSPTHNLYFYLYQFGPLLKGIRAASRFAFIVYIPLALGVTFVWKYIEDFLPQRKRWTLFVLFAGLLILENLNRIDYTTTSYIYPEVFRYQTQDPEFVQKLIGSVTLHLPIGTSDNFQPDARYLTWASVTGEILVNGYTGYFPSNWLAFVTSLKNTVSDETTARMRAYGAQFLLIHKNPELQKFNQVTMLTGSWQKWIIFEDNELSVVDLQNIR